MSFEFYLRIVGMIVMAFVGLRAGQSSARVLGDAPDLWGLIFMLVGSLLGLILTPHLTTRPARQLRERLTNIPAPKLISGIAGLIVGLLIAALAALPMSLLPSPYDAILPIVLSVVLAYFGSAVLSARSREFLDMFALPLRRDGTPEDEKGLTPSRKVLLDTSVIIDGRIGDISKTGFISGPMIVPQFVLNELQYIADSSDSQRRQRGRRGMAVLKDLQSDALVPVLISDIDVEGIDEVDEKLIRLAEELGCAILTNDFNLNRIAELRGVRVMNINDLANAVKTVLLPGEHLDVDLLQQGREIRQGVGYLEDGTMVVVEDGEELIGQTVTTTVTRVLQTSAGRMIFARLSDENDL
jgi:uncharacterized protein YacL